MKAQLRYHAYAIEGLPDRIEWRTGAIDCVCAANCAAPVWSSDKILLQQIQARKMT